MAHEHGGHEGHLHLSELKGRERTGHIYRVALIGLALNVTLGAGKLLAGLAGRSGALVADSVHSFSDMATDLIVLGFARVAARPLDRRHNYGYGKYETLATVLVSVFLLFVGVEILSESIAEIRAFAGGEQIERPGVIALVMAAVAVVLQELFFRYTVRVGRAIRSGGVMANAWHHRMDAMLSGATLLGVSLAYFLGDAWRLADSAAAILVALMVFRIALRLLWKGTGDLLERSLPLEEREQILAILGPSVTELRTRRIGAAAVVEAVLKAAPDTTLLELNALSEQLTEALRDCLGPDTQVFLRFHPI